MFNLVAVDDEKDVKVLFEHFFNKEVSEGKLNLFFETSAKDCLKTLAELEGLTIVLSDINMPQMNGIELLKEISEKYPQVKVLLVSAYDQNRYFDEMKKLGAEGYISKPVDFASLKQKVFSLVE
ncbi:MAG: response regulator [Bacteriovoracaceae bacterium]|jgi:DNA-binding NarL/FixJ family response regulator|nr:response regulator [Halobacteriovoraceae bacterium]MDP7320084.1 response regulator [Bacteriovoracaceae bacterium]|tara:strand:- start:113 stop:484 length:372 start_codon:yes stop_codon:yes gene_type:complete